MKENLENKIREAIPKLEEVSVGLNFVDELGFKAKIVHINNGSYFYFSESDNEVLSVNSLFFHTINKETVGHDIKLNDVLEYWKKKSNATSATSFKNELYKIVMDWDVSSVFLADQSEELKEFLNSL